MAAGASSFDGLKLNLVQGNFASCKKSSYEFHFLMWLAFIGAAVQAQDNYELVVTKLREAMLQKEFKHKAYDHLAYIVDTYGPRMWGSKQLEMVI